MIIDASEFEDNATVESDLCIIGAGVAGITIAREFIQSTTNVLLLESSGLQPDSDSKALAFNENPSYSDYRIDTTRAKAFGGSSHLWNVPLEKYNQGVRLRPLDDIDFKKREWMPYSGWPFDKAQLNPYYKRTQKLFKIGPYTYKIKDWMGPDYSNIFNFNSEDITSTIFQFGRKNVFYEDYRHEIGKADNINVCLHATVINIEVNESNGNVSSVLVESSRKKRFSVKAKKYILAAGGLENPRLLLTSNETIKCGLGNEHDLVGRFFMEHPHLWENVGRFYPSDAEDFNQSDINGIYFHNGMPAERYLKISDDIKQKYQLLNLVVGIRGKCQPFYVRVNKTKKFLLRKRRKELQIHEEILLKSKKILQNADVLAYAALQKLLNRDIKKWDRYTIDYSGVNLNLMCEQQPHPDSRITLKRECDEFGINKIKLDWRLQISDIDSIRKSLDIIDSELRRNGIGYLDINLENDFPLKKVYGGYHHIGTTRMHVDPSQGVVDEHCRVHSVRNLFIAGSSVFPTSGCANPTFTIAALSLRLADYLKTNTFKN